MKKFIATLACLAAATLSAGLVYGCFAFALWEPNPAAWSDEARIAMGVCALALMAVAVSATSAAVNNK